MCQIQRHENKHTQNKAEKSHHSTLSAKHERFPREELFCSNSKTNFQSVKCILPLVFIGCDTTSRGNIDVWRSNCTVFISKWLWGETSLINMSVRECYAPERANFWKHDHHSHTIFLSIGFYVFCILWWRLQRRGEWNIWRGTICSMGSFVAPVRQVNSSSLITSCTDALPFKSNPYAAIL